MDISKAMRLLALCLFIAIPLIVFAQNRDGFRGSIPESLLRPARGESARFPIDTIIGELGRGNAPVAAFNFANSTANAIMAERIEHPARDTYISAIRVITPVSFRIGSGRLEADGAVSFLVRFIGREQGIIGEMFVRYVTRQIEGAEGEARTAGSWVFEELLLDEPRYRGAENHEETSRSEQTRFDLNPYERFF